jgi:hypothetical protein
MPRSAPPQLWPSALPAVAMAHDEFVEVIVYDSIEDDIAVAYALSYG